VTFSGKLWPHDRSNFGFAWSSKVMMRISDMRTSFFCPRFICCWMDSCPEGMCFMCSGHLIWWDTSDETQMVFQFSFSFFSFLITSVMGKQVPADIVVQFIYKSEQQQHWYMKHIILQWILLEMGSKCRGNRTRLVLSQDFISWYSTCSSILDLL